MRGKGQERKKETRTIKQVPVRESPEGSIRNTQPEEE